MSDPLGFGKYVPGFDFLQNLARQAAGGAVQGVQQNMPQLPGLGNWIAPTFNVEELDKRIDELKAVHFWLEQNSKALGATIQALEVQKMTLATLKGMNFSLGDVANALKVRAADTVAGMASGVAQTAQQVAGRAPTQFAGLEIPPSAYHAQAPAVQVEPPPAPPPPPAPAPEPAPAATAAGVVDPMQWWGALTQQFQTIAGNALQDVAKQTSLDLTRNAASGLTGEAMKAASGLAGNMAKTVSDTVGAAAALGKAVTGAGGRGRGKGLSAAAWPIPGAVSPAVDQPAAKAAAKSKAGASARKGAASKPPASKAPARKAAARKRAG